MNKSNLILFGGAGFIGSHFKNQLKDEYNIHSYDLNPGEGDIYCDVRKKIQIDDVSFTSEDVIVNLAAIHRTPGHEEFEYFETNINGAINICNFAESKGISKIIFTSSIAPYGASEEVKSEESDKVPNTPYGVSKLIAENIHRSWQEENHDRKLLIIRPGVVYGKGENGNNTRLFKALKSGRFFYPGRKDTIKANIYVKDLVRLTCSIFDSYPKGTKIYNFTYEPAYSIQEIVETMSEVINKQPPKLVIKAGLLIFAARVLNILSFNTMGIHPDRIKKLMISTNISGRKLVDDGFKFNYSLRESYEDWLNDCAGKGLY